MQDNMYRLQDLLLSTSSPSIPKNLQSCSLGVYVYLERMQTPTYGLPVMLNTPTTTIYNFCLEAAFAGLLQNSNTYAGVP